MATNTSSQKTQMPSTVGVSRTLHIALLTALEFLFFVIYFAPPQRSYSWYVGFATWMMLKLKLNIWSLDYGNACVLLSVAVLLFLIVLNIGLTTLFPITVKTRT